MVQFAQKGYEVNAVSFMLKPVNYYDFSLKFYKIKNSKYDGSATSNDFIKLGFDPKLAQELLQSIIDHTQYIKKHPKIYKKSKINSKF